MPAIAPAWWAKLSESVKIKWQCQVMKKGWLYPELWGVSVLKTPVSMAVLKVVIWPSADALMGVSRRQLTHWYGYIGNSSVKYDRRWGGGKKRSRTWDGRIGNDSWRKEVRCSDNNNNKQRYKNCIDRSPDSEVLVPDVSSPKKLL